MRTDDPLKTGAYIILLGVIIALWIVIVALLFGG